jgi:hypothetical protein
MNLQTESYRVFVGNRWWRFSIPILQAQKVGNKVLVIFDYMSFANGRPAQNLVAFDEHQNEIWKAENPSDQGTDAYVNFTDGDELRVWNFSGFLCDIDLDSGRILRSQFTK